MISAAVVIVSSQSTLDDVLPFFLLSVCLWETVLPLHLSLWGTLRSIQVSASKQETISTCIYSPPAPLTHLMSTQSHKIDKLSVPPVALNISAAVSN